MDTDRPPDDAWGDDYPSSPPAAKAKTRARPRLDGRSEALRAAWIEAVRGHQTRYAGGVSRYDSAAQWDGGVVRASTKTGTRTYAPVWPKLVEKCDQFGINDPVDLVRALFTRWTSDTLPNPYSLVQDANINVARKLANIRRNRVAMALRAEEGVFRMAHWAASQTYPDRDVALAYVLNDTGRGLSPLFRYSLAVAKNLTDVAARWRDAAVHQLTQDPGPYLEFWDKIIPDELKTPAESPART